MAAALAGLRRGLGPQVGRAAVEIWVFITLVDAINCELQLSLLHAEIIWSRHVVYLF